MTIVIIFLFEHVLDDQLLITIDGTLGIERRPTTMILIN